jgi:hypothetical protein
MVVGFKISFSVGKYWNDVSLKLLTLFLKASLEKVNPWKNIKNSVLALDNQVHGTRF